jgi:hypothetical protein
VQTVSELREAVEVCEKSITRLVRGQGGRSLQSDVLCRLLSQYIRPLSSALGSVPTDEMRSMKRAFKEKIVIFEEDSKRRDREVCSLKQSLDKTQELFSRSECDMKRAHTRTTDPFLKRPLFSKSGDACERDREFEKMQKLASDQQKLTAHAKVLHNDILSLHSSTYARAMTVLAEISSMRRRLNRRIVSEVNQVVSRIKSGTDSNSCAQDILVDQLVKLSPTTGEFGGRLGSQEASLKILLGEDRRINLEVIGSNQDLIEYRAVQSYYAKEVGELSFNRNDVIQVTTKDASGWWRGVNMAGQTGIFPAVLVVERPAGAALPLQHAPTESIQPNLRQFKPDATWNSVDGSVSDFRQRLIMSQPPCSLIGVAQFRYKGESVAVESGEVMTIIRTADLPGFVQVRNEAGIEGAVPLNILTISQPGVENCDFTWINQEVAQESSNSVNW